MVSPEAALTSVSRSLVSRELSVVGRVKRAANFVAGGAFGRSAADRANHAAKLRGIDELSEICACGFRNAFFHQCAAEIVCAGVEAIERKLEAELHP